MKSKPAFTRGELRLFFVFLVENDALGEYLKRSAEDDSNFYDLFTDKNYLFPADLFIYAAFPWPSPPELSRWAELHKCWLFRLEKYRSIKK